MGGTSNQEPPKRPRVNFGLLVPDLFEPELEGARELVAKRCSAISRFSSDSIVQGLFELASDIKAGVTGDSYNSEKLWFFQLCRRIQRDLDESERYVSPADLTPFALVFVELLQEHELLGGSQYFHWDEAEVELLFLDEWDKVKIPEGETFISIAKQQANNDPQGFGKGMYGCFLDIAFHLQNIIGGPFAIPTSDSTASLLGLSGRQISTYIRLAMNQGFLVPHTSTYVKHVKARTFRFVDPRMGR